MEKRPRHKVYIIREIQSKGGQAVKNKRPPEKCPRCGRSMQGKSWHAYLGHLGMHGLADRYFDGKFDICQRHLQANGLARQDPAPWNGAWRRYIPVAEVENVF